jgi:hypothetical protein
MSTHGSDCSRIKIGFPWWLRPLLSRDVVAITIGSTIRIARPLPPAELEPLLRHERVHVRQMRELGIVRFLVRYGIEYLRGRRNGLVHDAAYRNISFEREAFAAEREA